MYKTKMSTRHKIQTLFFTHCSLQNKNIYSICYNIIPTTSTEILGKRSHFINEVGKTRPLKIKGL